MPGLDPFLFIRHLGTLYLKLRPEVGTGPVDPGNLDPSQRFEPQATPVPMRRLHSASETSRPFYDNS